MKKECDANGLEYELVMQESAKERFMRQVKLNQLDFGKHLVILKQKRQDSEAAAAEPLPVEPVVGEPAPAAEEAKEPVVGDAPEAAADSKPEAENHVGAPLTALGLFGGKAAVAKLTAPKLLVMIREHLTPNRRPAPTLPPFTLPPVPSTARPNRFTIPAMPTFPPLKPLNLHH